MFFTDLINYFWIAIAILLAGSVYLIVEGVKVHKIFAESIVGRLVKTLVVVFLIELYSLCVISFAFMTFKPQAVIVIFPIVLLWLVSLVIAIFAIRGAKQEVTKLVK
jgi:hypothetical protein